MSDVHYLEAELNALIQSDIAIWTFIQESSLDGVWYWDLEDPENEWMSPQFWRLFGVDPATKAHKVSEWQDLIFPEDLTTAVENFNRHLADASHPYDQIVRYRHADGHTVWVRCRGMAVRDETGRPVRFIGAHNDLTAVKAAEEKAREANRLKTSFLANMSHEIRTPLHGVLGMAQLLERTELDPRQREFLRILQASGAALMGVIEDVLDVSRIEAGKVVLANHPFRLETLLQSALSAVRGTALSKGLRLDVTIDAAMPEWVCGDEARLRQILLNLLGNAVKFTADGHVAFKAGWEDGVLRVDVTDTGCGVPEAMRDLIFDRFRQASEGHTRDANGAGLGLSICRDLAELAGGSVALAESQPEVGAHFVFTAPLAEASAAGAAPHDTRPAQAAGRALAGVRILVVEDNAASRAVITEHLTHCGASVVEAANGAIALEALRSGGAFEAVVTDLHMPQQSGQDLLNALAGEPGGLARAPAVLVITADVRPEVRQTLRASGAHCVLSKPLDLTQLDAALQAALGERHSEAAAAARRSA